MSAARADPLLSPVHYHCGVHYEAAMRKRVNPVLSMAIILCYASL